MIALSYTNIPHSSMNNNHVTTTIQTLKLPLIDLIYNNLLSTSLINHHNQLTPHILFQAITRRSTGEKTDMENLEILESAGYLTVKKTRFISNLTLYHQMIKKNLKSYLYTQKNVYRGKEANWLPPGYIVMKENIEESNNNNIYELGSLDVFPEDENVIFSSPGQIVSLPSIVCNDQCTSLINDFYHQHKFGNVEQR
ncbi:unnamed protein product [Didymodactylos carnosus]|uniref:Uncharacterized protein n=1 Tax=Didymodactylos carnosus TaxID=1234261 RepID=A0A8S2RXX6_9BILA|nr:unnamed protein product [Didymodactylos carnosus]CAF4189977.1 unnamed protein product [Didymodactylos carnosus]